MNVPLISLLTKSLLFLLMCNFLTLFINRLAIRQSFPSFTQRIPHRADDSEVNTEMPTLFLLVVLTAAHQISQNGRPFWYNLQGVFRTVFSQIH